MTIHALSCAFSQNDGEWMQTFIDGEILRRQKEEGQNLPKAFAVAKNDLPQLREGAHWIIDRKIKPEKKPLAAMMLNKKGAIPCIEGEYTSGGQLHRGVLALLKKAVVARECNIYIIAISRELFEELWEKAGKDGMMGKQKGAEDEASLAADRSAASGMSRIMSSMRQLLPVENIPPEIEREIVGDSDEIKFMRQLICRAAQSDAPVLIIGEMGTGKEKVAKAIRAYGPWSSRPYESVNCAAIPHELLESELFGYVKGAHNTAHQDKKGAWEKANGGILFLDEIGDLALDHQVKILRALQQGEIKRLGSEKTVKVQVRIITATNRNLIAMVRNKQFREELYYRLRAVMIPTFPLRTHPEDIPILAQHFWRKCAKQGTPLPDSIIQELCSYRWPGNVRELKMTLQSLHAMFGEKNIDVDRLRAIFELYGQAIWAGLTQPDHAPQSDFGQHRLECLLHLRQADDIIHAFNYSARMLMKQSRGGMNESESGIKEGESGLKASDGGMKEDECGMEGGGMEGGGSGRDEGERGMERDRSVMDEGGASLDEAGTGMEEDGAGMTEGRYGMREVGAGLREGECGMKESISAGKKRSADHDWSGALLTIVQQRLDELEFLCRRPILFCSETAYSAISQFKDKLAHFCDLLPATPAKARNYWLKTLSHEVKETSSVIFKEVERLLSENK